MISTPAAAVEVSITGDTPFAGPSSFTLSVNFISGELVPIQHIEAVIDTTSGVRHTLRFNVFGFPIGDVPAAFTGVNIINTGLAGYGYGHNTGTYRGYGYGYGYAATAGYGYPGYGFTGLYTFDPASGAGYGYSTIGGTGLLQYQLGVNGAALGIGNYRITARVVLPDGASTSYEDYQSPGFGFSVISGGGGAGSGGSGGGGPITPGNPGQDGSGGDTITVSATQTTTPTGAQAAFTASIPGADAGDTLVIQIPGIFPDLTLTLTVPLGAVTANVAFYNQAPPGSPPPPPGMVPQSYISITLSGASGTVGTISIPVTFDVLPDGTRAAQGVLMREENGVWVPHSRMEFTQGTDGKWTATGTAPCCSVFAVSFDTQAPQVNLQLPSGVVTGAATITATVTENLRTSKVDFYVNNVLRASDNSAPYEFAFNGATVDAGQHTIRAVATDFVGNTGEGSGNVQTEGGQDPDGPADPAPKGGVPGWVWFLIVVLVIALIIGAVVMSGKKK